MSSDVEEIEEVLDQLVNVFSRLVCKGGGSDASVKYVDATLDYLLKGNWADALPLLEEAAQDGHMGAQYALSELYENGENVDMDVEKAVYWCTKAAEQGHPIAQNTLGVFFYYGMGVPQDKKMARYWHSKAAEHGNEVAQRNLCELDYD